MAHPARPSDPPCHRQFVTGGVSAWSDEGQGPAVVLVHGLPGTGRDFRWLAPALTPHLRVIRVDLPGFGQCPIGDVAPTVEALGAMVPRVLEALDVPRAVVVGHSFGCAVTLAAGRADPQRVAGVGLLAPIGRTMHRAFKRAPRPDLWRRAQAHPLTGRVVRPLLRKAFHQAGFGRVDDATVRRTLAVMTNLRFAEVGALADATTAPTFGAWAQDDPQVEPAISAALLDGLPAGPRLRFDTGGHSIQKTQACEIAAELVPWVQALLG